MTFTFDSDLRAISLWQPWATLIAIGAKQIETRPWATDYRGWLAIHATKGQSTAEMKAMTLCYQQPFFGALTRAGINNIGELPHSSIVALAYLADVQPTEILKKQLPGREIDFGNYQRGRYGFVLTHVQRLVTPIPCGGNQQLWFPSDVTRQHLAGVVAAA